MSGGLAQVRIFTLRQAVIIMTFFRSSVVVLQCCLLLLYLRWGALFVGLLAMYPGL